MKRRCACTLLTWIIVWQTTSAQQDSKLTVPSSPSFSILSYEPTAVMRPTNAKQLAADVLNSFDKDGKLLLNLGLEVTPYWLKSHPTLDRATYLRPNIAQTFRQSLSLSAATVKDSTSGNNRLGAGFRFKIFNGQPVEALARASEQQLTNNTIINAINGVRATLDNSDTKASVIEAIVQNLSSSNIDEKIITSVKKQAETIGSNYDSSAENLTRFVEQLIAARVANEVETSRKVSELLYERRGFILEFAGASAHNTTKKGGLERIGFWANASYYVSPGDLFTLTSRMMVKNNDSSLKNFDMGLGFLKKTSGFNISIEGMLRWYRAEIPDLNMNNLPIMRVEKEFTYRLAAQGSFMVSHDISLNINFGKDFNSPFIKGTGFFSIFGLNYSIFNKEIPTLPAGK